MDLVVISNVGAASGRRFLSVLRASCVRLGSMKSGIDYTVWSGRSAPGNVHREWIELTNVDVLEQLVVVDDDGDLVLCCFNDDLQFQFNAVPRH